MNVFPIRKPPIHLVLVLLITIASFACDKVIIEYTYPPLSVHQKDKKPDTPVALGSIRAYFGEYYRTFTQGPEWIQLPDTSSNVYLYGSCGNRLNQITMLRSGAGLILSLRLTGYPLDSLPVNQPLPEVYGKYPQIDLYPFGNSGWGDPACYSLAYYIQKCIFIITDKTDDILTGTFDGMLISATGDLLPISEGEFRIKVFRKEIPCELN